MTTMGANSGDAARSARYAVGGVVISVIGNLVHLATKLTDSADSSGAFIAAVTAEALFGPALVFIGSHLLMHADRADRLERAALWSGFVCGAALSSVHLWAVAYRVLATGVLADIHPAVPAIAAGLLPIGVEGVSIGSIRQAARFRLERDHHPDAAPSSLTASSPSTTAAVPTRPSSPDPHPSSSASPSSGTEPVGLPFPEPLTPIKFV